MNGEDIRREPIEDRKRRLAGLLRLPHDGIALDETFTGEGATIYKQLARSDARASCRSGSARRTAPAASTTGSSSSTRRRRR